MEINYGTGLEIELGSPVYFGDEGPPSRQTPRSLKLIPRLSTYAEAKSEISKRRRTI